MIHGPTLNSINSMAALLGPRIVGQNKKLERYFESRGLVLKPAVESLAAAQADATSRLVKGPEFPTRFFVDRETGEACELPPEWRRGESSTDPGAYTVLSYRAWDDTYRLRPHVEPKRRMVPAPVPGPRLTETMSRNGRRAVDEAARYLASRERTLSDGRVVNAGLGFTTMVTFTLDNAARQRVSAQDVEGDYCDLLDRHTLQADAEFTTLPERRTVRLDGPASLYPRVLTLGKLVKYSARYSPLECNGLQVEGTHTLKPATTVQQELSRALDALQKMYQRGFQWEGGREPGRATAFRPVCEVLTLTTEKNGKPKITFQHPGNTRIPRYLRDVAEPGTAFTLIKPEPENLRYLWVAENPKNDAGQDNPHIHMLMSWQVPREAFDAWVKRIEAIWGQGFAHVERLRDPAAAGGYVLKAANYIGKGAEDGAQGWIFGNRYFISRAARAPSWEGVAVLPYAQLPLLMEHAAEHQKERLAPLRKARAAAREAIQREGREAPTPQGKSKLTGILKRAQALIEGREIIAGKWQVLLRGFGAVARFLSWANDAAERVACDLLPSKPAGFAWEGSLEGADGIKGEHGRAGGFWRTTPTADVVERRENKRVWRVLLRQPVYAEDDLENLREWYSRFEPVEDYCLA